MLIQHVAAVEEIVVQMLAKNFVIQDALMIVVEIVHILVIKTVLKLALEDVQHLLLIALVLLLVIIVQQFVVINAAQDVKMNVLTFVLLDVQPHVQVFVPILHLNKKRKNNFNDNFKRFTNTK